MVTRAVLVRHPAGERYRIGIDDGRIVRLRDGKPEQMVDAQDLMNPFAPNQLRIVLCAQILSGALQAEVPVVADEG